CTKHIASIAAVRFNTQSSTLRALYDSGHLSARPARRSELSKIDQTATLNPGDDGQRLMVVSVDPGQTALWVPSGEARALFVGAHAERRLRALLPQAR